MYSTDGKFIGRFGVIDDRNFTLSNPRAICTDRTRRLLVTDSKGIHIFTLEGNFINSIPCSINSDDVAVDPVGNVHVPVHYIAVYSQDGKQIETYDFGGRLQNPRGIYIDGDGNRFACGTGFLETVHFETQEEISQNIDLPKELLRKYCQPPRSLSIN